MAFEQHLRSMPLLLLLSRSIGLRSTSAPTLPSRSCSASGSAYAFTPAPLLAFASLACYSWPPSNPVDGVTVPRCSVHMVTWS